MLIQPCLRQCPRVMASDADGIVTHIVAISRQTAGAARSRDMADVLLPTRSHRDCGTESADPGFADPAGRQPPSRLSCLGKFGKPLWGGEGRMVWREEKTEEL